MEIKLPGYVKRIGCGAGIQTKDQIIELKQGDIYALEINFSKVKEQGIYKLSVTKISSTPMNKKFPELWTGVLTSNEILIVVENENHKKSAPLSSDSADAPHE